MIKKIYFDNFKSFEKTEKCIECITTLIGTNAAMRKEGFDTCEFEK